MKQPILNILIVCLLPLILCTKASASDDMPYFLNFGNNYFTFKGAFRFPPGSNEDISRLGNSLGPFTVNHRSNSIYILGHQQHQAIAEFTIPKLILSNNYKDLNFSEKIQKFSRILLNKKRLSNPQKIDRITGMELIEGELFVNGLLYYDAAGKATDTTFIIREPTNLKNSKVSGFFELQGKAHSAGWMSKMPASWQQAFDGSYIVGNANNYPINSRHSIGPTAFISSLDNYAHNTIETGLIRATPLVDYSLNKPLNKDFYNKHKKNSVWTEMSEAVYGFIPPNSNDYLIIGNSGGHESSIGYKIKPKNAPKCGGPCAYDKNDYYNYFWIYSLNDLLLSKNKKIQPHTVKPRSYGKITLPYIQKGRLNKILSADFVDETKQLFILIGNVDSNEWETTPLMLVYELM